MTDLSLRLQNLVAAAKAESCPSETAQARVLEALDARLGTAALVGNSPAAAIGGSTVPAAMLKAAAISAVGVALLGGAAWLYTATHDKAQHPQLELQNSVATAMLSAPSAVVVAFSASSPAIESSAPPLREARLSEAQPSARSGAAANVKGRPAEGRAPDRLAEEVALISRAQSELASSRLDNALSILDEHARKFPRGILTEERIAARIQALCALGRTAEANAQLNRLSRRSLHHRGQSQNACGAQPGPR
jgi:hypothetical protein